MVRSRGPGSARTSSPSGARTPSSRHRKGAPPEGKEAVTADVHLERHDTSFEVALHPAPETPARDPVFVDVVAEDEDRRPIVPAALRGWASIRATVGHAGGRWAHAAGYHG